LQRNSANLQALAGAGNPVYASESYNDLSRMLREAAADVCKPPVTTTTKAPTTTKPATTTTKAPTTTVPKTPTVISLRAQVKDVNGKYTPIKIPVVTTNNGGFPTGTVNTLQEQLHGLQLMVTLQVIGIFECEPKYQLATMP
jgi:hypothetical protein